MSVCYLPQSHSPTQTKSMLLCLDAKKLFLDAQVMFVWIFALLSHQMACCFTSNDLEDLINLTNLEFLVSDL